MTAEGPRLTWGEVRDFCRIVALCLCWYAVSSANGVLGKWILSEFPHPMTLTLVQLTSIAVYSRPMLFFLRVRPLSSLSRKIYWKMVVPLAVAKFLASVFTHVSIWKVPVSYAHTIKASMPLFTVMISKVFLGETYSNRTYASLCPIVLGVAIATVTEVSFDLAGLASALLSTAILASMAIFTKKVNEETGVHALRLLQVMTQISLILFLPVWTALDLRSMLGAEAWSDENANVSIVFLLTADGIFYFLQNIVAFTIMNKLSKLSYAVASATKRVVIITTSLLLLQNHVTGFNIIGMIMAIFGVFLYNKVKLEEKLAETLPVRIGPPSRNLELWNNNHYSSKIQLVTVGATSNGKYRPYQA